MSVRARFFILVIASLLAGGAQEAFADPHCASRLVITDGTHASFMAQSFANTTVTIMGQFIVDDDVLFQNCQVFMEAGAEIVVLPGFTLDVMSSSVVSCRQIMWKGITAQDGSTVRMRGSFVDDAENAVTALDGSTLWLRDNQFHNNRTTIHVPESEGVPWNNVAAYIRSNTFYSQGPMPQPYAGQATPVGAVGFAAIDVNYMVLDLTDGNNLIHHMSNGIVANQCDLKVTDCHFSDIQPDAAYDELDGNGAAINAYGGKGWYTLKQVGPGMMAAPNFERCRWGVHTAFMNVLSRDNHMAEMGTAHRIMRSGYRGVEVLNNKVRTKLNGIDLLANDGADHILIQYNSITFGDDPCANNCPGYIGINVAEGNYNNPSSVIRNNYIHYLPLASSRTGINLLASDYWLVADNQLNMVNNIFNQYGVQLDGCNKTEVSCNTISSTDHNLINDRQAAIRNFMGSRPLISCNDMNWTTNGLLFNGVASDTDVRGNRMRKHRWGLHLGPTAIIDPQALKGNLWHDQPVGANGLGALNQHPLAEFDPFTYNPAIIGGGNTQPPSWSPQLWFQPTTSGSNYECEPDGEANYCNQFYAERCEGCLTELDERVRSGAIENNPYTPESRWILKGELYAKLHDHPELLAGEADLQDFYDALAGSTIAALKEVADEQLGLYDLDNTVADQLQANRVQAEATLELMRDALEQLADPALTPGQRTALLSSIAGYRQSLAALTAYQTTALTLASTTKALTAENVKQANAAIGTSALIEANEKAVTEIHLATIGKDVDRFIAAQAATLHEIANQCPLSGGNAVFKARALYQLIDATAAYDDATLCLQDGYVIKSRATQATVSGLVVPNPAVDEATLMLSEEQKESIAFVVFDALGAEVMSLTVPGGATRFAFSTSGLAPALYHYQVRGPSGNLCSGKLTIVR